MDTITGRIRWAMKDGEFRSDLLEEMLPHLKVDPNWNKFPKRQKDAAIKFLQGQDWTNGLKFSPELLQRFEEFSGLGDNAMWILDSVLDELHEAGLIRIEIVDEYPVRVVYYKTDRH